MGCNASKVYPYRLVNLDDFWIGPYGIYIPNTIPKILDTDQCNYVIRPGNKKTNVPTNNQPISKIEYIAKYSSASNEPNNSRLILNLTENILNECEEYQIITINESGTKEYYKLMLDGSVFIETPYFTKTIYPIHVKSGKPIN